MANPIGWCDQTWNAITGCTPVSEACDHCYARTMATRLRGRCGYPADEPFRPTFHPERLDEPYHWRAPRLCFVGSMTDPFHESFEFNQLVRIFRVIRATSQHRYLILTKRVAQAAAFFRLLGPAWPREFGHVALGVTAENQPRWNERVSALLPIPAAAYLVSVEPMLGPIDFWQAGWSYCPEHDFVGARAAGRCDHRQCRAVRRVSWVIVGGETGPRARPTHPDWVRAVRDQCQAAGVAFWFKGWGTWLPNDQAAPAPWDTSRHAARAFEFAGGERHTFTRLGSKRAGHLLEGKEWRQMPEWAK